MSYLGLVNTAQVVLAKTLDWLWLVLALMLLVTGGVGIRSFPRFFLSRVCLQRYLVASDARLNPAISQENKQLC